MKVQYFPDTDTLYIELCSDAVCETRDWDENTLLDLDDTGGLCAITIEYAGQRIDIPHFAYQEIPA